RRRIKRYPHLPYTTLFRSAEGAGGEVPFDAFRQIRTNLGRDIRDPVVLGEGTASRAYLDRLYAALTEDMNAAAIRANPDAARDRSEEHTSELQSRENLVCR